MASLAMAAHAGEILLLGRVSQWLVLVAAWRGLLEVFDPW